MSRPKLTALQTRALIEEYKISFRGLLSPSQWPRDAPKIFARIRQMRLVEFDTYNQDDTGGGRFSSVDQLKKSAYELVREATTDRKKRLKENPLRLSTEPLVFRRFKEEMKCSVCSKFVWLSEFAALPSDPIEAQRLEKRRERRLRCDCPPNPRPWEDDDEEPGGTKLFDNAAEQVVEYDPRDGLEKRGVQRRKPDQIFGLARTSSLHRYMGAESLRRLRHSPFSNADLLYPFVICEAKSEEGVGFEHIEAQTAFPIRTCLKLQDDLRQRSGVPLNPFLWFISYHGDEWRVAACIISEHKYQIIDLWMGRTTSQDGALQLLLIIDCICEWARDVFRFEISCCLAGGKENLRSDNLRHTSPAPTYASRFSTMEPQFEDAMSPSLLQDSRWNAILETDVDTAEFGETASIASLTLEDSIMDVDEILEERWTAAQDESIESYTDVVSHPLLQWAKISVAEVPWSAHATIRYANMCLFAFSHLSLPNDPEDLLACLRLGSGPEVGATRRMATNLVMSLTDYLLATTTTVGRIFQLKNDWLRKVEIAPNGIESSLHAIFAFRTYIRTSDWQIVRELLCISCTPQTVQNLAKIAGFSVGQLRMRITQLAKKPLPLAPGNEFLRGLSGSHAASAAIKSLVDYLGAVSHTGSFDIESAERSFSMLRLSDSHRQRMSPWLDRGTALMEVLKKPFSGGIRYPPESEIPSRGGAILLRKGYHWPHKNPRWCLMVLDEVGLESSEELARRLRVQESFQNFNFAASYDLTGDPVEIPLDQSGDGDFLEAWIKDLDR